MDWTAAKVILDGAALAISVGVGVYAWWVNRTRANRRELDLISKRIDDNQRRLDLVERDAANAPSHSDINALRQTVTDLSGHVRELNGTMNAVNKFVDMMNEHLLGNGRRD